MCHSSKCTLKGYTETHELTVSVFCFSSQFKILEVPSICFRFLASDQPQLNHLPLWRFLTPVLITGSHLIMLHLCPIEPTSL